VVDTTGAGATGAVTPTPPTLVPAPGESTGTVEPVVAPEPPVGEVATEPSGGSGRRTGGRRGHRETEPAPPEEPPPEVTPPGGDGFLILATSPWTNVSCNGRTLGTTPIMRESLPPGHYSCRLTNPEEGIQETYELDIRAGETTRVRLGLR
jgi:serine/threonine-protein kinase